MTVDRLLSIRQVLSGHHNFAIRALGRYPEEVSVDGIAMAGFGLGFLRGAVLALAAVAPLSCAGEPPHAVQKFDPIAFFTGPTQGTGSLKKIFSAPRAMHVTGFGSLRRGRVLVLDQTVAIASDKPKNRQWQLRLTAPGHFAGTLSDAASPVTAVVSGNRLMIHYTMKGGMTVDQVLTLAPGGQSAQNAMRIHRFGITVATVTEAIRRF